jgi:hypothetical protein
VTQLCQVGNGKATHALFHSPFESRACARAAARRRDPRGTVALLREMPSRIAGSKPSALVTPKKGNSGSRKAREYTKGARVEHRQSATIIVSRRTFMIRYWIEVTDLDTGKVLNNSVCLSRK